MPGRNLSFVEVESLRTGQRFKVREDAVSPTKHRIVADIPETRREPAPEPEPFVLPEPQALVSDEWNESESDDELDDSTEEHS